MNVLLSRRRWIGVVTVAALGLFGAGAGFAAGGSDAASPPHGDGVGAAINDTAITAKVRSKLNGTDRLSDADIKVETTRGVVTLTGKVADSRAKDQAVNIAEKVDGVKSVDNQLTVNGGAVAQGQRAVSDGWITTKVKSKLLASNAGQEVKIDVSTRNGVVTLKGVLPNEQDVQHVTRLAQEVEGVKGVDASALTASR
jgi:hyperosmotically inducible protein